MLHSNIKQARHRFVLIPIIGYHLTYFIFDIVNYTFGFWTLDLVKGNNAEKYVFLYIFEA